MADDEGRIHKKRVSHDAQGEKMKRMKKIQEEKIKDG